MDIRQLLHSDYLDILFENRNKRYGGYELRRRYPERARNALLMVLLAAGIAFTLPVIASKSDEGTMKYPHVDPVVIRELRRIPKPERPLPEIPRHAVEPPAVQPTVSNPVPTVVSDDQVTQPPKPVDSLEGKVVGLHDNPGDPNGLTPDLNKPTGHGKQPVGDPADDKPVTTFTWVEQMPEFNGDLGRYLSNAVQYPEAAQERGQEGKVLVQFVVNEDGSISNIEILQGGVPEFEREAVRVVSGMPKWKPGRQNGQPVKVYFKLPVNFRLD